MTISSTEYPKQPPYSVRDTTSEILHDCPVKRQQFQFQQISSNRRSPKCLKSPKIKSSQLYEISEISKSSIIYHSLHQSIQTFNRPPVPMLLSKHKVQSIQNTQQTVMRYQSFRCNCYKTTQNADPLSSLFSIIETYQKNVSDILDINTAGKTRLHKHAC